jgi:sporulation protein YlmC with PRC-barrel domain
MRISELIDRRCVDVNGRELGRVFEFRARRREGRLVVESLLLGRHALAERYGAGRRRRPTTRRGDVVHEVAWSDVVRLEDDRVVVRPPGR